MPVIMEECKCQVSEKPLTALSRETIKLCNLESVGRQADKQACRADYKQIRSAGMMMMMRPPAVSCRSEIPSCPADGHSHCLYKPRHAAIAFVQLSGKTDNHCGPQVWISWLS